MATSKLLTLGGLGLSATATVVGPVSSLTNSGPAPYTSSLFWGLRQDSKNLYQTFDLKCVDRIFPGSNGSIKGEAYGGPIQAKDFKLEAPKSPTGDVKGCLGLYVKNYKDGDKGAVFSKIEMAVSKGDHGIILLNSITNTLSQGGWGFVYRALFLKNEGSKWQIKGGVQWQDSLFMTGEATTLPKIKIKLPENESTEEIIWKNKICTLSRDCDEKLKSLKPVDLEKTYEWKTNPKTQNIYQGIEIDDLNTSNSGQESDFWWKTRETPLASNTTIGYMPSAVFMDGYWRTTVNPLKADPSQFSNWFNLFKGDKGEWKEKTA